MSTDQPIVLVTGLGGRIGAALGRALGRDYTVVGLQRDCGSLPICVDADLASDDSVRHACEEVRERYGARLASVVHLAAYYDFSGRPSPKYREINV